MASQTAGADIMNMVELDLIDSREKWTQLDALENVARDGRSNPGASPVAEFEWTRDMKIGHSKIDEQNRQLLLLGKAVANALLNSTEHQPGVAQLQVLIYFAQKYFAFEEHLMRLSGYPEAQEHAKYHTSLVAELRTHCFRAQRGQHNQLVDLTGFLWNWIVTHIDSVDRKLAVWLKSRKPNGEARVARRSLAPAPESFAGQYFVSCNRMMENDARRPHAPQRKRPETATAGTAMIQSMDGDHDALGLKDASSFRAIRGNSSHTVDKGEYL